jgi:tetratricopeptide (TPR) repeat protein
MSEPLVFPLEAIRTDGWFERMGEGIGSFQALCDIVGARFFAFAMITGARITALTVDRRNPENTMVDFTVAGNEFEDTAHETQRLSLPEFRRRLVNALTAPEPTFPPPQRPTDNEAIQLHLGVRYLLLAPLYGFGLQELRIDDQGSTLRVLLDGVERNVELGAFRARIKAQVLEDLDRVERGSPRNAIDLRRVDEAEAAAGRGDYIRVLELLGAWPAPLAIFLRTPEGQMLNAETRATIARGLGLLGTACIELDEIDKGEEVLRLAVQYAGEGGVAGDIYARLGKAMLDDERPGEAIGPLRRAINLGANGAEVWPLLALALAARNRNLGALGAIMEALEAGVAEEVLAATSAQVSERLGRALDVWRAAVRA